MLKITIILLPDTYLSVIYGLKDILEYANATFRQTFELKIQSPVDFVRSTEHSDHLVVPPVRLSPTGQNPNIDFNLVQAIKKAVAQGTIPISICAGAFYLCASGIANGKQVTTHWALADALTKHFPNVRVRKEKILIDEGKYISAGGMTSFQDLALFLINRHLGRTEALTIAKVFLINPEDRSQLQYVSHNLDSIGTDSVLNKARAFINRNFSQPIGLSDIASACAVTIRTLLRHFKIAGMTPASYLQTVRMEHAKLLFETSNCTIKEAAIQCGYEDLAAFSRVFLKMTGIRPGAYQKTWRAANF